MKTIFRSMKRISLDKLRWTFIILCLFIVLIPSCQKNEENLSLKKAQQMSELLSTKESLKDSSISELSILYGHKKYIRGTGAPIVESYKINNPRFDCFDGNFTLKIQNGGDKKTRVASAEISIDGIQVVGPSDFSKNVTSITKTVSGLTKESVIDVKLNSTPGAYIDLWIEGKIILHIPTFDPIGPLCQNSNPPLFPLSSTNPTPIKGKWNPATINTVTLGKTIYYFTPDVDQCGTPTSIEIEVIPPVIPVFTQIGPLGLNSTPPQLPSTSTNGITGIWSPVTINTTVVDTMTYTFTPAAGQCANTVTMNIVVLKSGTVTDVEGNVYKTIPIGNQWWMAENLKTSKYRNGDLIATTTPATLNISSEIAPKYQWAYDGKESNVATYGRLYTWYIVSDTRNICPDGWHVPSIDEWDVLANFLGGANVAGGKMKEIGTNLWLSPNTGATNESGFTALPAGSRDSNGAFIDFKSSEAWWSSTENNTGSAWKRNVYFESASLYRDPNNKFLGYSIRCIKN